MLTCESRQWKAEERARVARFIVGIIEGEPYPLAEEPNDGCYHYTWADFENWRDKVVSLIKARLLVEDPGPRESDDNQQYFTQ